MRISEMMIAIAKWLENPNNEAMLLSEYNEDCMNVVAESCLQAAKILKMGAQEVDMIEPAPESNITYDSIDTLAEIATAFDQSGDPALKKSASALDELLLTIAAPPEWASNFKAAEDKKIDILKKQYQDTRDELKVVNKTADTEKAIQDSPYYKEYRSMEHALSARNCPDHAGVQLSRIGSSNDGSRWQCSLDKKIYDFESGFTNSHGDKVPGGSVSGQTELNTGYSQSPFDSRTERLQDYR